MLGAVGMIGVAGMATLALGSLLVTLSLNLIVGWNLDAACPGSETFCDGIYWQTAEKYVPIALFMAQLLVVFALSSPVALLRR